MDQFYVTKEVAVIDFRRGPNVGSDHFPLIAQIDLNRDRAKAANSAPYALPAPKLEEMERTMEQYRSGLPRAPQI